MVIGFQSPVVPTLRTPFERMSWRVFCAWAGMAAHASAMAVNASLRNFIIKLLGEYRVRQIVMKQVTLDVVISKGNYNLSTNFCCKKSCQIR